MASSEFAIKVDHLSKKYRIGAAQLPYNTLRDRLASGAHGLVNSFRRRSSASEERADEIWALRDVSFEVQPGEVVGVIGRNGAGKSTLLKLLTHITSPSQGRIEIHGRVGSLLEVGTGFSPELSGRENIFLNGAILGMKKTEIERKFNEIVAFSDIEKFLDTPVKHYSSGMYMRLAFAVAAYLEPEILLVDEVLAVGDAEFQKKCLGKMDEVAHKGRTVLFVSHNMPAIRSLCSRTILMDKGAAIIDGNTTDVLQSYLTSGLVETKKSWPDSDRPGFGSLRVNSLSLLDNKELETTQIEISNGGIFQINYEIILADTIIGFSLSLLDNEGNCIFSSLNNHEPLYYGLSLKPGCYITMCSIPGNLLNSGRFFISLAIFSQNRGEYLVLDKAIYFDAIDDGNLRGDYFGTYGGPFRPALPWHTHPIAK